MNRPDCDICISEATLKTPINLRVTKVNATQATIYEQSLIFFFYIVFMVFSKHFETGVAREGKVCLGWAISPRGNILGNSFHDNAHPRSQARRLSSRRAFTLAVLP